MSDIPTSWVVLPLGEVIQIQKGKKPFDLGPKSTTRTIPYINIKAFEKNIINEYAPEQAATVCEPKDILLVWDGARAGLSGRGASGYVGSTLTRIRSDLANTDYLYYFIDSCYGTLNTQTKGVGIPHINPVVLNQLEFPLPPEKEQIRIVDKLEEVFSDLDNGVAELKTAQTKLTQYRQSLLKSAVEGGLTQQWRETNKPKETGAQLLERILIERRKRWEQSKLEDFKAKDKKPPNDWQEKYPEPVKPDTTDLPELPEGWIWATIDQLSSVITSGSRGWAKYYSVSGALFIRAQNIKTDSLEFSDIAFVDVPKNSEGARTLVQAGDILLTITGANVGKCAYVDSEITEGYVSQHVALIRPVLDSIASYIHMNLINPSGGRRQLNNVAYGAGKPGLNLRQVAEVVVPVPDITEINMVMENIRQKNELITEEEKSIDIATYQLTAQKKNILKSAFSGELVEQDPTDEPASVLLGRIFSEREEYSKQAKPKRVKKKMARVKKINVESVTNWVQDNKKFSFDELRTAFSGDYDELKDVLFAILGDEKPIIKQVFDRKTKSILFVREQE